MQSIRLATNSFDRVVIRFVQSMPSWIGLIMAAATMVGQPVFDVAVGLAIVGVSYHQQRPDVTKAGLASVVMLGLSPLLKMVFHRTRPDTAAALGLHNYSFPSGHAFCSVLIYGLLAILAGKYLPGPWNWVACAFAIGFIILIGISRVYLGAHYPSDVLGGWIIGVIVLGIICKTTGLL
jgi:undecaprenyl-diphosphatase